MEEEEPDAPPVSPKVLLKMLRSQTIASVDQDVRPKFAINRANIMTDPGTTTTTTTTAPTTSTTTAAEGLDVKQMLEGKRREIWLLH